ncbi:MAG: glycosyltransferase family 87 protein [Anaerolineales bacterium]|nr:MAG: glycosyltransferase family 87 protein [Anaerolineales bacterium]
MLKTKKWFTIVGSIMAAAWMLFSISFNFNVVSSSRNELADFGSFIASGIELKAGNNPYGTSSPLIFEAYFPRVQSGGKLPNLNPPITLLVFESLADSDPLRAINLWRILSSLVYAISVLVLSNQYKPSALRILWAFSLAGFWHTTGLGQIYTPLLLLVSLIWINSLRKNQLYAGIFLGLLISIKPNFAIWLLLLAIAGNWAALKASVATIAITGLIPLTRMPPTVYLQWLEAANVDNKILSMPGNSSLIGLTSRIGHPEIGMGLAVLLILITIFLIHRARINKQEIPSEVVNSAGVLLCLLASPISWAGYTILALPIFFSLKKWGLSTSIAAAMLTVPFNFIMHFYYLGSINFIFWGWWYGLALTICMTYVLQGLLHSDRIAVKRS